MPNIKQVVDYIIEKAVSIDGDKYYVIDEEVDGKLLDATFILNGNDFILDELFELKLDSEGTYYRDKEVTDQIAFGKFMKEIEKYSILFGFNGCWKEVANNNGELDLLITHNNKSYRIVVDKELMFLKLYERNQVANRKAKEYYHRVKNAGNYGVFRNLLDVIGWIENRNRTLKH
ncbi:MAG: hypothetical protein ACYC4E_00290 [Carboxydocellales bacterium]